MMMKNLRYILASHRGQILCGVILVCAGIYTGAEAESRTAFFPPPIRPAIAAAAGTASEATPAETVAAHSATPAAAEAELTEAELAEATLAEAQNEMLPDRLNLAFITVDGEQGGPGVGSMAQLLYEELANRESEWTSQIYDLYNQKPVSLAAKKGIGADALRGQYNAGNPAQNPQDPSTWAVPDFKSIHVTFLDGSGGAGAGESNLKEIMAMTSVYSYYGGAGTWEELRDYAMKLWENSHSYDYQIGPVYYCEGCLEGDGAQDGVSAEMEMAAEIPAGAEAAEVQAETAAAEVQAETAATEVQAETAAAEIPAEAAAAETAAAEIPAGAAAAQIPADGSGASEAEIVEGTSWAAVEGIDGGPGVTAAVQETEAEISESRLMCPGHVDLAVQISMAGLDGRRSLFARDIYKTAPAGAAGETSVGAGAGKAAGAGQAASAGTEAVGWPGWNEETMGYVRTLCGQDWFEKYGLTVENLVVRNPLTAADIALYMNLVPQNASQSRRDLVRYALTSVGRVPYYWGGKPGAAGYESNRFGIVTAPDMDGRFLKGLDCSGWVSWVYWSATGSRLSGESTGSQIHCGRAVAKEELLPGDICIRLGSMAHAVIFLGWTDEGKLLCIQETSGNINNVEVGIVSADWPYYRRLVE